MVHCVHVVITRCLGKIAEINEFSASDEMFLDCSKVEGRQ